jgi:EAL domain-containing protein (putative c-di-GMP-specific phosphodiesterase class I)
VLQTACRQTAEWLARGYALERIAVNISTVQIQRGNIHDSVSAAIAASGLEPDRLELEITESTLMQKGHGMITGLDSLRTLGVELSIDDFGTGYSSLSYLKQLPIDKLKIDRSFVKDLPDDEEDVAIAGAVIALSKSLGIHVTAEGVETEAQKNFLMQLGCDEAQGYLFSKPVPADELPLFYDDLAMNRKPPHE